MKESTKFLISVLIAIAILGLIVLSIDFPIVGNIIGFILVGILGILLFSLIVYVVLFGA